MKNELLKIGPFTMYGYGTMIGIGILCAWLLTEYRAKKRKIDSEYVLHLLFWCVAGGFAGAKLLFLFVEWRQILKAPEELFSMLTDGFVVFGGILGGIAAGFWYCKKERLSFLQWFDFLMPAVAVAQGFGRIGCFLAGCCYGKETDSFFSVIFHSSDYAPNGIPLIPVQLYASILDFLLAALLLWLSGIQKKEGRIAAGYLILYSFGRFFLEFFRGDTERGMAAGLSVSQYISLFTFAGGILLLFCVSFRHPEGIKNSDMHNL